MIRWHLLLFWLLGASGTAWGAVAVPSGPDAQVVEVLPQVTTLRPAPRSGPSLAPPEASRALGLAREAIATARSTGDSRYWGRAQTALGSWWDSPNAPPDLMVLQATVLQGQHQFVAAQARLRQALKAAPKNAQGWLTLATLLKLDGRYPEALDACNSVAQSGAELYARACVLELRSLRGADVDEAWSPLLASVPGADSASWLLSLWGEHLERYGQPSEALKRYQQSLALRPDLYTSLVQADVMLRQRRGADALVALQSLPDTDAVLLRRAFAQRLLKDSQWKSVLSELQLRQQGLQRRGEALDAHAREFGLMALWLQDDPKLAWRWAQRNIALQKEPVDWWLALQSARQAEDRAGFDGLVKQLKALGLKDVRLDTEWTNAS